MAYKQPSSGSFKMMGSSPAKQVEHEVVHGKQTEEVVSKTSPGPGWTKTKGTNIWAPPKGKMMMKESRGLKKTDKLMKSLKQGFKEGATEASNQLTTNKLKKTLTRAIKMNPPYKKPVGPRAN